MGAHVTFFAGHGLNFEHTHGLLCHPWKRPLGRKIVVSWRCRLSGKKGVEAVRSHKSGEFLTLFASHDLGIPFIVRLTGRWGVSQRYSLSGEGGVEAIRSHKSREFPTFFASHVISTPSSLKIPALTGRRSYRRDVDF